MGNHKTAVYMGDHEPASIMRIYKTAVNGNH